MPTIGRNQWICTTLYNTDNVSPDDYDDADNDDKDDENMMTDDDDSATKEDDDNNYDVNERGWW